jgi:hypothetical protein
MYTKNMGGSSVDIGAQYLTLRDEANRKLYETLKVYESNTCVPNLLYNSLIWAHLCA